MDEQQKKPTAAAQTAIKHINSGTAVADWYNPIVEYEKDQYTQLGNSYRLLTDQDKNNLTANIINAMQGINNPDNQHAFNLQLCHWFRMDMSLGMAVARGLNINLQDFKF